MENSNQMSWLRLPTNKQLGGKYTSLIGSIAITMLLTLGIIYIAGGMLTVTELISALSFGYNVSVDVVYTLVNTVFHCLIFILPIKLFSRIHGEANREKHMPVEKEIVNKKTLPMIFLLGLGATFLAWFFFQLATVSLEADSSGLGDDLLWQVGLKYPYQVIAYIIGIVVIPAIAEEILCRKILCDALAPYGQKTAIVISAILFSLLHADFSKFLHTFVLGIFLGWLYVGTKKLWISIALHFVNNLLSCISTLLYYRVSSDAYVTYMSTLAVIYIIFVVPACFIFLKIQRKKALAEEVRVAKEEGTYDAYLENKRKHKNHIEMLPGEDGEEVTPLSKQEKIKGFFSPLNIAFIFCAILVAFLKIT